MLIMNQLEFSGSKIAKIVDKWKQQAETECGLDVVSSKELCDIIWDLRDLHGDVLHQAANKAFDDLTDDDREAFLSLMDRSNYDIGAVQGNDLDLVDGLIFYYQERYEPNFLSSYEFSQLESRFEAFLKNNRAA